MTISMKRMADLASEYGQVDINDPVAVEEFYHSAIYELSPEVQEVLCQKMIQPGESVKESEWGWNDNIDEKIPLPNIADYPSADDEVSILPVEVKSRSRSRVYARDKFRRHRVQITDGKRVLVEGKPTSISFPDKKFVDISFLDTVHDIATSSLHKVKNKFFDTKK